jgi:hypothetical protein
MHHFRSPEKPQFHHQPCSSLSINYTAASIERVTLEGLEGNARTNSASNSADPDAAVSSFCKSFFQVHFAKGPLANTSLLQTA